MVPVGAHLDCGECVDLDFIFDVTPSVRRVCGTDDVVLTDSTSEHDTARTFKGMLFHVGPFVTVLGSHYQARSFPSRLGLPSQGPSSRSSALPLGPGSSMARVLRLPDSELSATRLGHFRLSRLVSDIGPIRLPSAHLRRCHFVAVPSYLGVILTLLYTSDSRRTTSLAAYIHWLLIQQLAHSRTNWFLMISHQALSSQSQ